MEPIINPWFFYWLQVADFLSTAFIFLAVAVGVIMLTYTGATILSDNFDKEDYRREAKKSWTIGWSVFAVFLLLALFTPTKKTFISMYVAKHITTDNVQKALTVGKDFKEEIKKDIFELINEITKEKEKKGGDS